MAPTHAQVRALAEQALDLDSPAEREQLLAACGDPALAAEVRALLGLETKVYALEQGAARLAALADESQRPASFGPYRVLGVLGRGGMGDVYLGVRDDGSFRKEVAIKVARDVYSAEQQHRFLRERELLARLEHPAIAHMLDGGSTASGQAWMAIERVDGVPLDQFAHARSLSVRERVGLFLRVLDGVQYAHQNLIVHRDLKPSNVLVQPDGQPKLLDFGIAKLLGSSEHTQTSGRAPMTLAYAAPEQIRGVDVTTATDVYALGVILFELLTGERPYKLQGDNPLSLLQAITDTDAPAPSESLRRRSGDTTTRSPGDVRELRGDLDTIVQKALNRDPLRRYPSAQSMRDDLERFLAHQPIKARPDSVGYRARKWLRRNRAVAAVAALAAVGLLVAAVLVVQERNRAIRNAQAADATKRFVLKAFTGANRWLTSENLSARDLALRGLAEVDTELKDQPEARIEMFDTLARAFAVSGPPQAAIQATEAQIRDLKALGRTSAADLLDVEMRLARSYLAAEQIAKMRDLHRSIEQRFAKDLSAYDRMTLLHEGVQADVLLGDYASVERALPALLDPQALDAAVASRPDRREMAETLASFAHRYQLDVAVLGRYDADLAKAALEMARRAERDIDKDNLHRANFGTWVADYLLAITRDPALLALEERANQWNQGQFGPASSSFARLGALLQDGQVEEAAKHFVQMEAYFTELGEPDDSLLTCRYVGLEGGYLALRQGDPALARERFGRAMKCAKRASEVIPHSIYEREVEAALAYLDLLEGKIEPAALALLADGQRKQDDAAWWRSTAWLADWHWQHEERARARELLEALRHWHQQRGARYDVALLAQYELAGLPVPAQPVFDVAEAVRIANELLADGERIREQRLQRNKP
jgi:hypothetical protein